MPDTLSLDNNESLNTYLVSEQFELTDDANFTYGVKFGVSVTTSASSSVSNGQSVQFKVELIDDITNEVIGTLDDITFNSENIVPYQEIGYQVNTEGIGNRTCRLRLVIEDNLEFNYSLVNGYNSESSVAKRNFVEKTFGGKELITTYELSQNYPNPFNPSTVINYQIPKDGLVTIKIYDILGKEVTTLVNENKSMGRYSINFDGSNLASGVYIYKLKSGDFVSSKKMMLIK